MVRILLCIFQLFLCSNLYAETIWCNPANTGTQNGITKGTGYAALWTAMDAMNPGDTLIIANGDWSNSSDYWNAIRSADGGNLPPSGTSYSSMSTIRAETDWGVKLPGIWDDDVGDTSYVKIQGIIFMSTQGNAMMSWNHSEFIRCGFFAQKLEGNSSTFSFNSGSYNLVEDCIAWGGGRYKFLDYHGSNNIFRRSVARHDWYIPGEGIRVERQSNFRGYGQKDSAWQNCISIDSDREQYQPGSDSEASESADFYIGEANDTAYGNVVDGSMVVKGMYVSYFVGGYEEDVRDIAIRNSVAIGPALVGIENFTGGIVYGAIDVDVTNSLFVNLNTSYQNLISHVKPVGALIFNSSIARSVGPLSAESADYNYYYNASTGGYGTHSINADPFTNGLLYPVRVESGSALATAGSSGGVVGPTILKKIGVSGTHKDQTGWDTPTDDNLWPFPNEGTIKTLMSTTVDGVSGVYGFTSGTSLDGTPQTLTKYIWEQFGNQIPPDIYGSLPPLTGLKFGRNGLISITPEVNGGVSIGVAQ